MLNFSSDAHKNIAAKVFQRGQEHLFKWWDELSDIQQEHLIRQLSEIDFDLFDRLVAEHVNAPKKSAPLGAFQPPDIVGIPDSESETRKMQTAREIGETYLKEGKVAAFLVAGGQGTRLGFNGPKGAYKIGPVSGKYIFQLHAEKILRLSERYGHEIPWYIMTSDDNHKQTVGFFEEHNYFGIPKNNLMFFQQDMIPGVDRRGKMILSAKDSIFRNPNGHGGSLLAMQKSGALADMKRRGISQIFYFQVDNVIVKICDPTFLGLHIQAGAGMSSKVVDKASPEEKVGVIGVQNGRLQVVEYSDLSKDDMYARASDGKLKFRAGSIAIHAMSREFVESLTIGGLQLPYHKAEKAIPYIDENGNEIKPSEKNGIKFETFVFDALAFSPQSVVMEVSREDEFAPVKNASGEDSAETARVYLANEAARWLKAAGLSRPSNDSCLEVSPRFATDLPDFLAQIRHKPSNWKPANIIE